MKIWLNSSPMRIDGIHDYINTVKFHGKLHGYTEAILYPNFCYWGYCPLFLCPWSGVYWNKNRGYVVIVIR